MSERMGIAIRGIDVKWIIRSIVADVVCGTPNVSSNDNGVPIYGGTECNGALHALWTIRDRIVSTGHDRAIHNDVLRLARDMYDIITWDGVATDTRHAVNGVLRWLMAYDASAWDLWESCLVTDDRCDDDVAPNAGSAL